jgi:hypothetical protein
LDNDFEAKIILWKQKPSEYSKFYFFNASNTEILKQNTGLNKKSVFYISFFQRKNSANKREEIFYSI